MSSHEDRWLSSVWKLVQPHLPAAPSRIFEIGCGPVGGLVPAMRQAGHDAVGIDPAAPAGDEYVRSRFEDAAIEGPVDAVVACVSLHHVEHVGATLDRALGMLRARGVVVVMEWDWERFDVATATWCFDRLAENPPEGEHSWLHHHRERWQRSGKPWSRYLRGWVAEHGVHAARAIVRELDARVTPRLIQETPYFFSELCSTTWTDERRAIDAGAIQATGLLFVGTVH